jgi:hypothetical protein
LHPSLKSRVATVLGRLGLVALLVVAAGTLSVSATSAKGATRIDRDVFGQLADGTTVFRYTLTNGNGMRVRIITYGGIIQTVEVPDRRGHLANVTLGYDSLADYVANNSPYFGALIGRYSTVSPTSCPSTTTRTACTAAQSASTRRSGPPRRCATGTASD